MASKSKPSNKYTDQHLLMGGLPYILLKAKEYFKNPSKFYIRSSDTSKIDSPATRLDKPMQNDLASILKINNIDLASVVPKIEFYKVVYDKKGNIAKEIFIPYAYDARKYAENIYGNREQRGDDVGIQNVSFVYDEQNPVVAEALIGCTVEFVFANAEALVTQRNAGFRFVDLFAFPDTPSSETTDRDKYDIILKVGYQLDGIVDTLSSDILDALKKQERIIKLGMIDYDLVFQPNGMLKATVEYKSSNINFFSDSRNEIFGLKRLSDKNPTSGENVADKPPEEIKPAVDLQQLYSGIQKYMAENCMIQTFDAALVNQIANGEYYFSKNPCVASGKKNDLLEDLSQGANIGLPPSAKFGVGNQLELYEKNNSNAGLQRTITFFFFGDLLEAILATNPEIVEQMKSRRFAFLLDNTAYQFIKGGNISVFNIAKLPIAQSAYNEWFSKNIIAKEKKIESLMSFVKNILLSFVSSILRMRVMDQIGADYTPNLIRRLISVPNGLADNKHIAGFTKLDPISGKSYYAKNASNSYYEYYTIYDEAYYNDQLSIQAENISEDDRYFYNLASGVPHFYIGADKGLLKEFSFRKSSLGEQIAVIRNLEPGNPYSQVYSIFDINAEFIGNNLMSVGKNIYLDPSITGLGSPFRKGTVSNRMGLGGYYMVSRVQHNYYPKWTTSVTAVMIVPASQQRNHSSGDASFIYF